MHVYVFLCLFSYVMEPYLSITKSILEFTCYNCGLQSVTFFLLGLGVIFLSRCVIILSTKSFTFVTQRDNFINRRFVDNFEIYVIVCWFLG